MPKNNYRNYTQEEVEQASEIAKMTKTPGFILLQARIDEAKQYFTQNALFYKEHPEEVGFHAGALFQIQSIESFISENLEIINDPEYVQEDT